MPSTSRKRYTYADGRAEARKAENWNRQHPVGTSVRYWTGAKEGPGKLSTTRAPAELLSGHTAVVWIEGEAGCVALSHVEPV